MFTYTYNCKQKLHFNEYGLLYQYVNGPWIFWSIPRYLNYIHNSGCYIDNVRSNYTVKLLCVTFFFFSVIHKWVNYIWQLLLKQLCWFLFCWFLMGCHKWSVSQLYMSLHNGKQTYLMFISLRLYTSDRESKNDDLT